MKKSASSPRIAIYPGTFDPVTNGHLDILERALALFDEVVFAIAPGEQKKPLFSLTERMEVAQSAVQHHGSRVRVVAIRGLLVEFAREQSALAIVRGLRAVSDFEFEFQMALMNRKLAPDLETIFLMPKNSFVYLSSSLVKEVARLGGCVSDFVPTPAAVALRQKFANMAS